jgi:hypothetical protein
MSELAKRSTIYLDPDLHRALRIKSVHTQRSMSELVNEAVRLATREDQEERAGEPTFTYEELLKELRAHGKL